MVIYLLNLDCGQDRLFEFAAVNRYPSAIWRVLAIDMCNYISSLRWSGTVHVTVGSGS